MIIALQRTCGQCPPCGNYPPPEEHPPPILTGKQLIGRGGVFYRWGITQYLRNGLAIDNIKLFKGEFVKYRRAGAIVAREAFVIDPLTGAVEITQPADEWGGYYKYNDPNNREFGDWQDRPGTTATAYGSDYVSRIGGAPVPCDDGQPYRREGELVDEVSEDIRANADAVMREKAFKLFPYGMNYPHMGNHFLKYAGMNNIWSSIANNKINLVWGTDGGGVQLSGLFPEKSVLAQHGGQSHIEQVVAYWLQRDRPLDPPAEYASPNAYLVNWWNQRIIARDCQYVGALGGADLRTYYFHIFNIPMNTVEIQGGTYDYTVIVEPAGSFTFRPRTPSYIVMSTSPERPAW